MLSFRTTVSLLWLISLVHLSKTRQIANPEEITEIPVGMKTDFARHAMEISDLLRMFISLIKRADEEEGREFGLPEITTTVPIDLESASIEELFDRFETAAQSFRTRFLKYLKSKEPPSSSVTPTISTVVELNKGEDLSKYVYEHEDVVKVDTVPDSEIEAVYSTSTINPETENTLIRRTSLAFILPTESSDTEIETDSSTSTVLDGENINSSTESSTAFIVPNEDTADSDYSASTIVAEASDSDFSGDGATLAFILSNGKQSKGTKESLPILEETSDRDIILTLVPVTKQNSKYSFNEQSLSLSSEFDTTGSQFDPKVALNQEDPTLNGKSQFIPATVETIDGTATLILQSNEDVNTDATFSVTDDSVEATVTPFLRTDDLTEGYTFIPLSTTNSGYSDEEIQKLYTATDSAKETNINLTDGFGAISEEVSASIEDLNEITSKVLTTAGGSDEEDSEGLTTAGGSDEEGGEGLTTAGDSDEEDGEGLTTAGDSDEDGEDLTTAGDSDEEDSEDLTTAVYSDEEDREGLTTADSDEEDSEGLTTAGDSDEEDREGLTTAADSEEDGEVSTRGDSDPETIDRRSAIEDKVLSDELVKMLKEISEKYKQFEKRTNENVESREDISDSKKLVQDLNNLFPSTKKVPKITERLVKYIPSNNGESDKKQISSNFEKSGDMGDSENLSNRFGLMEGRPTNSHLDVIGVAGENYPNYTHFPATSFTCKGKEKPGFYGDLETRCQVFHVCWPNRVESYLCPVGSTFHQEKLFCDYWFHSTCSLSPDYYGVNIRLRNYPPQDELNDFSENIDIYPDNFPLRYSHPVFNRMKFLPFMYKISNSARGGRGIESGKEIDYNETIQIEFDQDSTLPAVEDLHQETTTDMIDSVKERFRELLKSFVESETSKNAEKPDNNPSLHEKLQERKYVYEKMSVSRIGSSGILPEEEPGEKLEAETAPPKFEKNHEVLYKNVKSKSGKEQIAPAIVFKVLETAENVVTKGILPMTRDLLAANYIKLYKKKKL